MKKNILVNLLLAAVLNVAVSACSKSDNAMSIDKTTYETIDRYAGEYARALSKVSGNDLELERLIFDIRSRERRLETEIGKDASSRFINSLTDSIKAIDPSLAASLKL